MFFHSNVWWVVLKNSFAEKVCWNSTGGNIFSDSVYYCWWLKSIPNHLGCVQKPVVNNGISTTNFNCCRPDFWTIKSTYTIQNLEAICHLFVIQQTSKFSIIQQNGPTFGGFKRQEFFGGIKHISDIFIFKYSHSYIYIHNILILMVFDVYCRFTSFKRG